MEVEIDVQAENKEIVSRYRKLMKSVRPLLKDSDPQQVRLAFNTALEAHKEMRRKSGEPYIFHPIAVAQICVDEIGLGPTAVIAALLHDVVEDTDMELKDIEKLFGVKVAKIIDGLTKISGVFQHGSSQQAENFRKMLLTLSEDVRVILIKIADRLHNMRTLESMPRNSQLKISSETIYLYAPLAHRLGLYSIKTELEDLYLKYTEPEVFRDIANKIQQTKATRNKFIKEFVEPIDESLNTAGFNYTIKGRPKSIHSIWNKIKKQKVSFEEIYDLFAIRIILDTDLEEEKSACWKVYSIVTDFYKPNPDRLRDWVSTPKSNGYESLHVTVMSKTGQWVEVQIRTQRMDEIAEKGFAAHWKYKESHKEVSNQSRETGIESWITKVREMIENQDGSAIEFVNDFRNNLFSEEVYVFTPKGDLKILPAGSTALDFAFDIHTKVGASCLGAKVNNKLVPISYKLHNGDQIEILTSSKQKPSEDWLKIVVTSKAVAKIKDSLKEQKKLVAIDGKEIVERKVKQLKLDLSEEVMAELRAYFDCKTNLDFFYLVGRGSIDPGQIKKFREEKVKRETLSPTVIHDAKSFEKEIKKVRGVESDQLLIGENMDKIDYTLAKCCNPIPGDDVFGFVTVNEGIKIHRTSCPNAVELMSNYGYRIIKAKWTNQKELAFLAGLRITGTDRMGLVQDVTRVISNDLRVNMRSISIDTDENIFEGKIMLFVHDTAHLEQLIRKLTKVDGVVKVDRFDT
ncbi:MAG TPA: RelA/SpoT family protein [Catalimonadaceae bacterium]|nr:RelA/SpoT family protein [Catalimonadaceae bacterium]HPI11116.1 RelA/SpoT family protein [Catalimonadaceae bacterium]